MEHARETLDNGCHLYPKITWRRNSRIDDINLIVHSTTYESANFGMKFSLRGRGCNIPEFETRNREGIDMCIAFMHRKSREFSRFKL
jgi:hypothetical protein